MKYGHAFVAGVIGGVVVSAVSAVARVLGVPVNFEILLGTILGHPPSLATWLAGLAAHLAFAGLVGLLYGWGFETLSGRADWRVGLGFGLVHAIVAGVLLWVLPAVHPLMAERIPAPGPFLSRFGGLGVLVELVVHLTYGATVGALYGPTRRHAATANRLRRAA
jgi:hypothetical protein